MKTHFFPNYVFSCMREYGVPLLAIAAFLKLCSCLGDNTICMSQFGNLVFKLTISPARQCMFCKHNTSEFDCTPNTLTLLASWFHREASIIIMIHCRSGKPQALEPGPGNPIDQTDAGTGCWAVRVDFSAALRIYTYIYIYIYICMYMYTHLFIHYLSVPLPGSLEAVLRARRPSCRRLCSRSSSVDTTNPHL